MAKAVSLVRLTHPDQPLRRSAPVLLIRLNEMLEWASAIPDPACVEELHNMRIAAKRLRYTMELFLPTLNKKAKKSLSIVEEIQEQIGAIHDCDVLLPLLKQTMEKEIERERKQSMKRRGGPPPFLAAEGLLALMHRKEEERERRYREFIVYWNALTPQNFSDDFRQLVLEAAPLEDASEDRPAEN